MDSTFWAFKCSRDKTTHPGPTVATHSGRFNSVLIAQGRSAGLVYADNREALRLV